MTNKAQERSDGEPKASHTPGPWKVSRLNPYMVIVGDEKSVNKTDWVGIADCDTIECVHREEAEQNAALIAAAPELLEAAKSALHALEVTAQESIAGTRAQAAIRVSAKRALRIVIAKAEGR